MPTQLFTKYITTMCGSRVCVRVFWPWLRICVLLQVSAAHLT